MNCCIDLILGKAFCIFIFFHFPDSRLSVLKGFHLYFCFLTWVKTENFRSSVVTFRWSDSRRSWGHGRQEGCARSGSSTAFVAQKSKDVKAMNGFCITRVMDVLSVFTFSYLKCLHSWRSISNFRKIFVAEGNSYIFFVPFSNEHFTFHVYSPSLKCRLVRFDCVDTHRANKNYHTWQRSLAVHFISSFIDRKWHWKEI